MTDKRPMEHVAEIIVDKIKDSEDVKESADNLGKALLVTTTAIKNALLPLAALNYGIEKARQYFETKFSGELSEKVKEIPPEDIVDPKPYIAAPALQGLAFTHEEESLKELFLNLIAASMDRKKSALAHPAFVEIIKQLDPLEARLLQKIISYNGLIPVVELHYEKPDKRERLTAYRHLLNVDYYEGGEKQSAANVPAMVDNWVRLGLVVVDYSVSIPADSAYGWVEEREEFLSVSQQNSEGHKVVISRGVLYRTDFGENFSAAVGVTR
ncbi:DUF4393 domain-containing protein [Billgrantia kenyensis]|uniref:DUF4393 domain-containing protein n=1 Tax=Billgrantia kenyensis TaxID=321266 RepID=A0A7V9W4W8_9GAMM|nr:DUF4393 domain-containing protein [Halomonas kenyensis]MBA2781102.1 DUF4393 domain-containing protein [Halomonas kenyensis]MCG6663815.1 DUF4393 domain-containing protein [Halomonas kenyensis]